MIEEEAASDYLLATRVEASVRETTTAFKQERVPVYVEKNLLNTDNGYSFRLRSDILWKPARRSRPISTTEMPDSIIAIFARECQLFAGRAPFPSGVETRRRHVEEFISRLPLPEEPLESLVLAGLLVDVAVQWSRTVHEQHHVDDILSCSFDPAVHLMRSWRGRGAQPTTAFAKWATTFLDTLDRSHRLPPATQVKAIVDANGETRLNTRTLARETGCHPTRLRALFKRDFGITIREYQTRRQIMHAARLLSSSDLKVDVIARASGFPNRKNFYEAFERIVGTNPSALRGWSRAELSDLERQLLPRDTKH
jgi:AraC-like DNA-binding protein